MQTYIILARFSPGAYNNPKEVKGLAARVREVIQKDCRNVEWLGSYATLGRYDLIDIVESDIEAEVRRAAMLISAVGHCTTETLVATRWRDFLDEL